MVRKVFFALNNKKKGEKAVNAHKSIAFRGFMGYFMGFISFGDVIKLIG